MAQYLVFRLYGPLASWGSPAVGSDRQTELAPSRSAILGFLGAALGIKREQEEELAKLQQSVSIAVKQTVPSSLLRDYHTTQVPSTRKNVHHATRKSELEQKDLNTILSSRDYRCDAIWVIAISLINDKYYTLEKIQQALISPTYLLSLGRKSCPLALPMMPTLIETARLKDALDTIFPVITHSDKSDHYWFNYDGWVTYYWEQDKEAISGDNIMIFRPWDEPINRKHWQFRQRTMYQMSMKQEAE